MASAKETGRAPIGSYELAAEVLVAPPLDFEPKDLRRRLGMVTFGNDRYFGVASGSTGVHVQEISRLGDISQIIRLEVFDAEHEDGAAAACDRAVGALCTYVTAMAEGNAEALAPYIYPKG